jgi:Ca2+-transporting ATPase
LDVPAVSVIHAAVRGRARFSVAFLYRSPSFRQHLESCLSANPSVNDFSASIVSGNVLVHFNPEESARSIALLIEGIVAEYRHRTNSEEAGYAGSSHEAGSGPLSYEKRNNKVNRRRLRKLVVHAEIQNEEPWHLQEAEKVVAFFNSSIETGLSADSIGVNFKKYGPNLLTESVPRSAFNILIGQFKSIPVYLLTASAVLSIFTGGVADAVVIMAVVAVNAAIGYITESKSEMTINSLKRLVRPSAMVMRDGKPLEIKAEEVVPGEVLILKPGTFVTADSRIVESNYLSVDESALTGESLPSAKRAQVLSRGDIPLADRLNMAYMGTLVTGGQGFAVVVGTGRFTEIGRIQTLVGETRAPMTPMEKQLEKIGNQLVLISSGICGVVFLVGLLRGYGFLQMLRNAVSLAVAAIPEGLPAVATTTLALGIRDMKRQKVLIRKLEAVETLGSVRTICLDKTGTLTFNRMSVVAIIAGTREVSVHDGIFTVQEKVVMPMAIEELRRIVEISVLCNESEVVREKGEYAVHGSSTENALIHLAITSGFDASEIRKNFPLLKITHRSETRNFMITVHGILNDVSDDSGVTDIPPDTSRHLIALKGNPQELLRLCNRVVKDGGEAPMTDEDRFAIELANERMAGESLRVLGVAYRYVDGTLEAEKGFTWIGLVGMADPLRPGVSELIGTFHHAGIDTVMITGDQVPTAYAIGRELGLSNGAPLEIFDSSRLQDIEPELLTFFAGKVQVFARVSPAQKLQIVQALQRAGRIVAMTGDGINDSPALKAADIGIAMGRTGTDAAREVADVVLEDDNLETMVIAISQGRTIYSNIRKSVHFLLSTNLTEIMVMFAAITGGMGQPLNAMQLLWINLVSDIFPGLALALEPPETDILDHPPRDPEEPIITNAKLKRIALEGGVISTASLGAYGYGLLRYGMGPRAGTIAFMSLSSAQLQHTLSCRSETVGIFSERKLPPNPYLKWALGGSFALQALTMVIPGLRSLLGITPIGLLDSLVISGSAILPFIVNESTKEMKREASHEKGLHVHVGVGDGGASGQTLRPDQ